MHQIVVTILHCLPPPLFPQGNWSFSGTRKPPPGNGGQKVTRNGGPQFGAWLILSEIVRNVNLFTKCLFTILGPLNPPPNQQSDGFFLNFWRSQTNFEHSPIIANKLSHDCEKKKNYEQTGVSELLWNPKPPTCKAIKFEQRYDRKLSTFPCPSATLARFCLFSDFFFVFALYVGIGVPGIFLIQVGLGSALIIRLFLFFGVLREQGKPPQSKKCSLLKAQYPWKRIEKGWTKQGNSSNRYETVHIF